MCRQTSLIEYLPYNFRVLDDPRLYQINSNGVFKVSIGWK